MTTYLFNATFTSLGGAQNPAQGDLIVITASGSVIEPTQVMETVPVVGQFTGITLNVSGLMVLDHISLYGTDAVNITRAGSILTMSSIAGLITGTDLGPSEISIDGTFSAPNGLAIMARAESDFVRIGGAVFGYYGVQLGVAGPSETAQRLTNTGEISAFGDAVTIYGSGAFLSNAGQIHSATGAAIFASNSQDGAAVSVINTGSLISDGISTIGVQMSGLGATFSIHNTGIIANDSFAYYSTLTGADYFTNTGTVMGAIDLGAGNDRFEGQGGRVTGSIFLGSGGDYVDLRNSLFSGAVFGGDDSDVYFVSEATTGIVELALDSGTDQVMAQTSFRLGANIENLTLLDSGDYAGNGNGLANLIFGNLGQNRLFGLDGLDTISGDAGDDRLSGGNQADSLDGNDGDDTLLGNLGNDNLRGSDGDDVLNGGFNKDTYTGGTGSDRLVFAALNHTGATQALADVIADFGQGEDVIDLSGIDAIAGTAANDGFSFIGNNLFSPVTPGQARFVQSGSTTFMELEVTGDGAADAMIRLTGLITLTGADFLL